MQNQELPAFQRDERVGMAAVVHKLHLKHTGRVLLNNRPHLMPAFGDRSFQQTYKPSLLEMMVVG